MRIAVIQFPGSNCERETMLAIKRAEMEPVEFLWNGSPETLREMDGFVIVGGFSYEDRSRAGVIAALDPVMQELKAQSESGKPILGICNGAQILVESGLVPGLENNKVGMALTENKRIAHDKILGTGYYNAWVHMRLSNQYQRNAFTSRLSADTILHVPIAHGEGRFVMTDVLLKEMQAQGLNVFQYCNAHGEVINRFPINPNGSIDNIAAVSNKVGNVMAMMPHPERTTNGDAIWLSMRDYIAAGRVEQTVPLYYYPRRITPGVYQKSPHLHTCIVELVITDNQAVTVQNTLRHRGIPVTVRRQVYWEIDCATDQMVEQIKQSGALFNERKEREIALTQVAHSTQSHHSSVSYLVRSKDDLIGQQKQQILEDHFAIQGVKAISHGILWHFSSENGSISALGEQILQTNIIHNPYAHECYQYHDSII
jgi:phosphoribosylformylglycinamidine synthase I